jgi:endogenous inhibitor of DNA gyrase (YacG/DUF329 family)
MPEFIQNFEFCKRLFMIKGFTDTRIFKCPGCGKPISFKENPYRPFCSKKCKMMDLGAWFKEEYQISSPMESEDELKDLEI